MIRVRTSIFCLSSAQRQFNDPLLIVWARPQRQQLRAIESPDSGLVAGALPVCRNFIR
jgi:hypothetical protein